VRRLGLSLGFELAFSAVARGDCADAVAHLAQLDATLADRAATRPTTQAVLRVRGRILALSETLT
jgi:hypothetical protein